MIVPKLSYTKTKVTYLYEATAVAYQQVQAIKVERLLGDGGASGDGRAPLLHECQQPFHPPTPLRGVVHFIQLAQRVRLLAQIHHIIHPSILNRVQIFGAKVSLNGTFASSRTRNAVKLDRLICSRAFVRWWTIRFPWRGQLHGFSSHVTSPLW